MKCGNQKFLVALLFSALFLVTAAISFAGDDAPRIMKEEIDLDDPSLLFLDVQRASDWRRRG
jgi:hypothetical protein